MRILVPVDGSVHSKNIVRFLGTRSTLLGRHPEIELLNVQYSIPEGIVQRFGLEAVREVYEAEGDKVFGALNDLLDAEHVQAAQRVVYGEYGRAIANEAERFNADLIIMGTRGLSPIKSFFLGSVSQSVLQYSRRPILLIRESLPPLKDSLSVMLAADDSPYGTACANFVAAHPHLFGEKPSVDVVNVALDYAALVAEAQMDAISPTDNVGVFAKEREKLYEQAVNPPLEILTDAGIEARAVRLDGSPAQALADYAKTHCDLVVMGTHGYGNFTAAVLGSTAMKMASEINKPILVVRPQTAQ